MAYSVGIDLGTTYTAAAVYEDGRATTIDLAGRTSTMPSIVFLDESGQFVVGESASRRAAAQPSRASQQFKRRFGDTTPLLLGGSPFSADALSAELLKSVVALVSERQGGPPSNIALTYPANWGGYKLELFEQAIRRAGLDGVETITEPEAAVLHYAQLERVPEGALVAVFDLGGGTFDAAIVRKTADGTEFLGRPEGIERLGGIDFDDAVFSFVDEQLDGAVQELDLDDEASRTALERLRRECVEAKEALSTDEAASITVLLPNVQTTVRITRTEFEQLIRPPLTQAIDAMHRAVASAGVAPDEIDAVLLAGGSSRIPLVAEMVGSELGRPVAVDAHPKHVVAMGAALAAHQAGARGAAVVPPVGGPPSAPVDDGSSGDQDRSGDPTGPAAVVGATQTVPVDAVATEAASGSRTKLLVGGLALLLVVLAVAGFFVFGGGDDSSADVGGARGDTATTAAPATTTAAPTTAAPETTTVATTEAPATTVAPTTTAVPTTEAPETTAVPTTTVAPTTTAAPAPPFPPTTRRAELTGIELAGSAYEVAYDTINFEPLIAPDRWHLHFFWNTFDPASVGVSSDPVGEWVVWDVRGDGEQVYDAFGPAARPPGADAICAVVATSGHEIDAPEWVDDTVSCIDLPA